MVNYDDDNNYLDDFDDISERMTASLMQHDAKSHYHLMRRDLEIARDKLSIHKRNNAKRAYYNQCIQLLETFKYDRIHPFDNDYIDRLPKFLERKYRKSFTRSQDRWSFSN